MAATEVAKPFDGTPISTALEFRKRNRRATGDVVDAAIGSSALQVSVAGGGASINIADGRAIVQGALYELTGGPLNKAVGANGGGSNRTDYAVLTYDDSHNPGVYARVLQGTALTRSDTGVWDMPLATWQKTPAGSITNLVDLRPFRGSVIVPCTSTTRPTDPTVGMVAYETDTGLWIGWTGLAWVQLVPTPPAESEAAIDLAAKWPATSGINKVTRYGRVISINLNVTRAVDTFQGTDPNGSPLGTIPSLYRPTDYGRWFNAHITPNNYGRVRVETDGGIWLDNTTSPVTVGRILRATLTYLR